MIRATTHFIRQCYRGCFTLPEVGKPPKLMLLVLAPTVVLGVSHLVSKPWSWKQAVALQAFYVVAFLAIPFYRASRSDSRVAMNVKLAEFHKEMDSITAKHNASTDEALYKAVTHPEK